MIKETGDTSSMAMGEIIVGHRDMSTGEFTPFLKRRNKILYSGADIMAGVLSGDASYVINGMYFKYQNTAGTPSGATPSREMTAISEYHTLDGGDGIDWLRVPIITRGAIDKTSDVFAGNKVSFVATTASVGEQGQTRNGSTNLFNPAHNSKIFSVALVAMPDKNDKSKDVAFSMANLSSAIPAIANSYIDIFWTITFL